MHIQDLDYSFFSFFILNYLLFFLSYFLSLSFSFSVFLLFVFLLPTYYYLLSTISFHFFRLTFYVSRFPFFYFLLPTIYCLLSSFHVSRFFPTLYYFLSTFLFNRISFDEDPICRINSPFSTNQSLVSVSQNEKSFSLS